MSFDDLFRRDRRNKTLLRTSAGMPRHIDPMNPSERIDHLIAELADWLGKTSARIRESILAADREIIEEWKRMGSPVWSHDGIMTVANTHQDKVTLTFFPRGEPPDPDKLFNAGSKATRGEWWRFFEGDKINERAPKNFVRATVDYNQIN